MRRCTKRLASELDACKDENTAIGLSTANISEPEVQGKKIADKFEKNEVSIKILFLPVSRTELNPNEMVWSSVKRAVAARNINFQLNDVEELTKEHIDRVTAEQFRKFCIHVIEEEGKYRAMTRSIVLTHAAPLGNELVFC